MNPDWKHERFTANGIRFHVVTAGSTSAPLVVLLHGFPEFWYAWRHQIPALAERFRVAVPDLRGYGDSDKPPRVADYAIDVLAADVAGLVRALGESKATIVGHDWGGGVAWATALEHPDVVEKLIVLNCPHPAKFARALRTNFRQLRRSWYMFFFQLPRIPERLLLRKDAAILDTMFRGMAKRPGTFSDEDLRELKQAIQKPGAATGAINYYRAAFRNFRLMQRMENHPRKISAPTLLIWGDEDVALGKELTYDMDGLFTGPFRLEYVPGCSHWVNEEQPEIVNRLMLDFLGAGRSAA